MANELDEPLYRREILTQTPPIDHRGHRSTVRTKPELLSEQLHFDDHCSFSGNKWVNDPVHGHIELDGDCINFVDSEQFQRLRDLKQLGSTYYVYPGAVHNRFEHSLGVCHLSGLLISRFQAEQPELEISFDDIKCIKLAGLCHDLGHGPYSHVFDTEFMPKAVPNISWSHEEASEMMLDSLIENNNISIEEDQVRFIKDLIHGKPRSSSERAERGYLYEIVANKKNSLDVDKFDYIKRDCQSLNEKSAYDPYRLMQFSRVINNEIAYHQKDAFNVYEMFHTRFSLFKKVYTHKVGKAIEYMITDALLAANPYLKISDKVHDPDEYLHLTDDILRNIERSTEPELAASRAILKRLRLRQLYRFVDEMLIPQHLKDRWTKVCLHIILKEINAERVVEFGSNLSVDDVIVEFLKINYAHKDKNPVDHVKFYSKYDNSASFPIERYHISHLVPEQFEDLSVRVYSRDPDKVAFRQLIATIHEKFENPERLDGSPLARSAQSRLITTPPSQASPIIPESSPCALANPAHSIPGGYESPKKRRMDSLSRDSYSGIVKKWAAS